MLRCDPLPHLWRAVPTISWAPVGKSTTADLQVIFGSQRLKHLALTDVHDLHAIPEHSFAQLKTLHLIDCGPMPLNVPQAEAMVELQKLTIQDSTPLDKEGYPLDLAKDSFGKMLTRSLAKQVMLSVRQLPCIREITGECALLKLGKA